MMVLFVIKDGIAISQGLRCSPSPRKWLSSLFAGSVTLLFAFLIWEDWPNFCRSSCSSQEPKWPLVRTVNTTLFGVA